MIKKLLLLSLLLFPVRLFAGQGSAMNFDVATMLNSVSTTADQTITGNKTFTGQTSISSGIAAYVSISTASIAKAAISTATISVANVSSATITNGTVTTFTSTTGSISTLNAGTVNLTQTTTRYLMLTGADFQGCAVARDFIHSGPLIYSTKMYGSIVTEAYATLHLPQGAVLRTVIWDVSMNNASASMTGGIYIGTFGGVQSGGQSLMSGTSFNATNIGEQLITCPNVNYTIDNTAQIYTFLIMPHNFAYELDTRLYGVELVYTITQPLP